MPASFILGRPIALLLVAVLALAGLVADQRAAGAVQPLAATPVSRHRAAGPRLRGAADRLRPRPPGARLRGTRRDAGNGTGRWHHPVRRQGRGAWWVTVEAAPAALVSVGPLGNVRIGTGERVGVRTVLGTTEPGHDDTVHLGLRLQGIYTDPLRYLAVAGRPRLVPLPGPPG